MVEYCKDCKEDINPLGQCGCPHFSTCSSFLIAFLQQISMEIVVYLQTFNEEGEVLKDLKVTGVRKSENRIIVKVKNEQVEEK